MPFSSTSDKGNEIQIPRRDTFDVDTGDLFSDPLANTNDDAGGLHAVKFAINREQSVATCERATADTKVIGVRLRVSEFGRAFLRMRFAEIASERRRTVYTHDHIP